MMTSKILKFLDFTKTQKSRYLKNKTFFLQITKPLITHLGLLYNKKDFCSGGSLNVVLINHSKNRKKRKPAYKEGKKKFRYMLIP